MAIHRALSGFARILSALLALGGVVLLTACGGGSGAPNNLFEPAPVAPGPLAILPATATLYANAPVVFTVSGGVPPYSVFSSDSSVLPLAQQVTGVSVLAVPANVSADVEVVITARDSLGATASAATIVRPAALINGLAIAADSAPTTCTAGGASTSGTTVVCSGDTGTAQVRLLGAGGTALAGRQVRFDVVQGGFAFFTNNPVQPLAASVTVTTDQGGTAIARFQANVNAPSAFALIRATELDTGNQVTGSFTIAQITSGDDTLLVVPDTATITGPLKGVCSSGFATDYYIFGGTPPYRIVSTFPNAVTLVPAVVNANGGFFRATTNGTCVDPLQFAITDATGRTVTAELSNVEGTAEPPEPEPASNLVISPNAVTLLGCPAAPLQRTFLTIGGGTPPYNVTSSNPLTTFAGAGNPTSRVISTSPAVVEVQVGATAVITVVDSGQGTDKKIVTATVTCQP